MRVYLYKNKNMQQATYDIYIGVEKLWAKRNAWMQM